MDRDYLDEPGSEFRVYMRVSLGAKKTEFKGTYGEQSVRLSVAEPLEKGQANAEVERDLARILGGVISEVEVVSGASSRDQVALVRGIREERAGEAFDSLIGGHVG